MSTDVAQTYTVTTQAESVVSSTSDVISGGSVSPFQIVAIGVLMIICILAFGYIGKLLFSGNTGKSDGASIDRVCEKKCRYIRKMEYLFAGIVIIVCCVSILTVLLAGDSNAFTYFSFASTITSIILSVIAIFMTISGESKTETTKDKVDITVARLDNIIEQFEKQVEIENNTFEKILEGYQEMKERMDQLSESMKVGPGKTYTYTNENYGKAFAGKGYKYDEDDGKEG